MMDKPEPNVADLSAPAPLEPPKGPLEHIRNRIISGLVMSLPIVLTFWIIYWLYSTFQSLIVEPLARAVHSLLGAEIYEALPWWWESIVAPGIAIILVLSFLYVLGLFVRSRLTQAVTWVLLRVPVVTTIYRALNNVFESLDPQSSHSQSFKRVVLVEFPQPGMRSLGLVTRTLKDEMTGKSILCVCMLTGVMPPTGFTLFVPEEQVTDLDWSVNQSLQAIVSGGISTPDRIRYFDSRHLPTTPS